MDIFSYLFMLVSYIFWPLVIALAIYSFVRRRRKLHPGQDEESRQHFAYEKEILVSQAFFLLAFFFLGATILFLNRDFNEPLSYQSILFLISFIGLVGSYFFKTIPILIISLFGLIIWWGLQAAIWVEGKDIGMSVVLVGFTFVMLLFYALGRFHEQYLKFKNFASVYLIIGMVAVTGILFFFSTKVGLSAFEEMNTGGSAFAAWQLVLSLAIFLAALLGVSIYALQKKLILFYEFLAILFLAFLFGLIPFVAGQGMFSGSGVYFSARYGGSELSGAGIIWTIVYNFSIFFELLGLIFLGYVRRETWLINLGALFLFILIVVKYFDWFFSFLDKSIFFIGAGILLFAVGWFMEKGRKKMILEIKSQTKEPTNLK